MKRALRLFSLTVTSIILLLAISNSAYAVPGSISFVNGTPQGFTICQNATATSINSFLTTSDNVAGETLTWSVFLPPAHGTLGGFNGTGTSIVGNSTPSGLTYTPTPGYSGGDLFQIQVSNGVNSAFTQINITVQAAPTPTFTSSPGANTCTGTAVTYTTQTGGGLNSYSWSVSGVSGTDYTITSGGIGSTNNTVTINWISTGSKTVTVNYLSLSGCTGASPASSTTTVNSRPTPSFTTSPASSVCGGVNATYTTQSGQSAYTWSVPGVLGTDYTIAAGSTSSTSNSVAINWITPGSQTVTVNYSNAAGCNGTTAASASTTVLARPVATFTTAPGPNTCAGSSVTYTTQAGQFGYVWLVPGTGGVDYSITSGSIGSTSNSVTLTWNTVATRNVQLNYSDVNGCTSASNATNTTVVNARPIPTFTSSATANTCAGTSITYTTQGGEASYSWGVPGTAGVDYTITAGGIGAGSSSVTLFWRTSGSKTVTVNYTDVNGCAGVSAASNTTLIDAPNPTFSSSPGPNVCAASTVTYTTQTGGGINSYIWSVPGTAGTDYNITSGGTGTASNTVTLNWVTAGNQTVTVNYTDLAGCTGINPASNTTSVHARPTPSFSLAATATSCVGANITYATQASEASYSWTISGISGTDYSITSGSTSTNSVTLNWLTTGSQTVTVNYTDVNGCTGASAASNTTVVNAIPSATFTTSPGASICAGTGATYTTQTGGGINTYVWSVPGTAGIDYNITSGGIGSASNTVTLNWLTGGSKTVTVNYSNAAGCGAVSPASNTTTVHAPTPTFTAAATAPACTGVNVTYTTQAAQASYSWTIPGVSGTDYTITSMSGGTLAASNSVTLSWITTGSKTVSVNYTDGFACTGLTAASTTVTVNSTPAAIGGLGAGNVCTGFTLSLTSSTSGGSWTSSTPALANVGSSTGVVTGYSPGTPTIYYTVPSGCASSAVVTVNQSPTGISGTFSSCTGGATTLTNGYSGGVWTSAFPAIASIGSSTGMVSANSPGTSTISYTLTGNCTSTVVFTDNVVPAAIGGAATVCAGLTTTLTDATTGGVWTSSASGVVSIWSGSGFLTGVSAGTSNISYTLSTGCYAAEVFTVNPVPAAITGTPVVCVGLTTALGETTTGGLWSSSTSNASVGTGGVVVGVSAGNPVISYTIPSTTCYSTIAATVNPVPAAITGAFVLCSGLSTTLGDATGTGGWSSNNTGQATIDPVSGVVTGVGIGGNPTISYTLATGCYQTTTLTVNPLPAAITGTLSACPGTTTSLTDASGTTTWTSNNTAVATVGSGTGVVTGVASGTSTITFTLPTGCIMTALLTVNPNPAAITGTAAVCQGLSTNLADGTGGGSWSSSASGNASVGSATGSVLGVTGSTNAIITYTLPTGCIATRTVTVNPLPLTIGGANSVCALSTTTLTDGSGTSTWTSSNTSVANVGATTGIVSGVSAGSITITFALATGCIVTQPFTVNPTPVAITGVSSVCVGATDALADATSGGTWSITNGTGTATVSPSGVVTGGSAGTVSAVYTLAAGSCTATLPMTVNATPGAISGLSSVCTGASNAIPLTDATTVGIWSSSNVALATVAATGAGTSSVTGISSGALTITFTTTPGSCFAVLPLTVNPTPPANTGTATVCTGQTTTLANGVSGGNWSSSTSAATVIGSTGVVTGVSVGNPVISYVLATNCFSNTTLTVNLSPATISGTPSVCTGQINNTLGNTSSGGTWSSSNSNVTIVGSTGVVTGITAGSVTITYTLPGGCFSTLPFTVNQTAPAVAGSSSLCTGVTTTLSDGIGGGLWSSLASGTASVGSASGIATGVAAGTTTISYTLPDGCVTLFPVTVNTQPAAISGATPLCTGLTTVLTDATPGGSWSSSSSLATVTSGTVTGISTGSVTISYTLVTIGSCTAVFPMTINPSPAAITGTAVVCTGFTTNLYNSVSGGVWSPSLISQATVGATSGIVTGVSASVSIITYKLPAGCFSIIPVTVNTTPSVFTVTGGGSYCYGGTGVSIGLSNSTTGVNYQLFNGTTPIGATVAGTTGSTISFGLQTATGIYTVVATSATNGCSISMSGSAPVSTNPLPALYTLSGGGSYCSGGAGLHIALSGTDVSGTTYQLYNSGTALGAAVSGTGTTIDFGLETLGGSYTAVATITSTGCSSTMTNTVTINVLPLPVSTYSVTVTGGGAYCAGGTGVHVGVSNSDIGINYQLYNFGAPVGSLLPGTGGALDFGLNTAGSYTIVGSNAITGCSAAMTGTQVVTANVLPTAYSVIAPAGAGYCAGGAGVDIKLSGSATGINYQLYLGSATAGAAVAGTGIGSLDLLPQFTGGVYTVIATNTVTACSTSMSGSVTVTVNPLPTAYTVTVTGGGVFCAGGLGQHVGLAGSTPGISYQLWNATATVGGAITGTGTLLDFGLQPVGTYSVVATNPSTGCTGTMTGTVTISTNPLPNLYTMSASGSYCFGGTGVDVSLGGSDAGISYQLYLGATPTGAARTSSSGTIDFGLKVIAGTYTVLATNLTTSCSVFMTGNTTVTVNPLPALFTVTGGGSFCAGGTGVVVGLSGSTSGTIYQVFNGTTAILPTVTGTGSNISFGLQAAAGGYTVVATSAFGCPNNMTGSALVSINPLPNAYTVTGGGAYCVGGAGTHVGLSSSDIGVNYQLWNGTTTSGLPLSGTGAALDFGMFIGISTYTVSAINPTTTCNNNMTGSATISTILPPVPFTVSTAAGAPTGSYCAGGTGVQVVLSGSIVGVNYQLYRGTTPVGSVVPGAAVGNLNMGFQTVAGTYTAVATNASGCTANMTGSATISINPLPNVYTMTGGGGYCTGGAGAVVGLSGSDASATYQLYRGGSTIVGGPTPAFGTSFNFGTEIAGTYTAVATYSVTSCSVNMLSSATVTLNTLPASATLSVSGSGHYCSGGTGVTLTLSSSTVGVNYQLYNAGSSVGPYMTGTGSSLSFGLQTAAGTYTVIATNATTGCIATMSGTPAIVIDSLPAVQPVTGGGSYCPYGTGVNVGLLSSALGINYQLYYAGSPVVGASFPGTAGGSVNFGLQTGIGTYTVVGRNATTGCSATMTGSVNVSLYTPPTHYLVSGGGSYCAGGSGLAVTLSGSQPGVNYQLMNSDTAIGSIVHGTGVSINFGSETVPGYYIVTALNTTTGCVDSMNDSAQILINALPALQTLTGGGSYCPGGTGVNISLSSGSETGVHYQLYNGTTAVGSPVPGTSLALNFGLFTVPGIYTVVATNATTLCNSTMTGADTVSLYRLPAAYSVTGGGGYCSGGAGAAIGLGNSDTGISYRLYHGASAIGSAVAGTGSALSFGLQTTGGVYTVTAVNTATGCTYPMTGSATIVVNALPYAYNVTGGGGYCIGGTGVPVSLSGSNTGISYQLLSGGIAIGAPVTGTGGALSFGLHTVAGNYSVTALNTTTSCTSNMLDSVNVAVNPLPAPYLVSAGAGGYCPGGTGVVIYISYTDLGVNYQLYRGTSPIGLSLAGTGTTGLDFGPQTVPGTYTVIGTNTTTGCVRTMTGSGAFTIYPLPASYGVTGGGNYCAGGAGVHVGLGGSNIGVNYQLYNGGIATGAAQAGTGILLDFGLLTAPGVYTIVATSAATGCTSNMTGTSTVAINPLPVVDTVTGGGNYCAGGTGVHVGLNGSVTGINYQLYMGTLPVSGVIAGTGLSLDFGLQTTAGSYTIVAQNATTSCTSAMAGSATVGINLLPGAYTVSGGGNFCPGGTGVVVGQGGSYAGISYQLYLGASTTGSPVYGTGLPVNFGLQTAIGTYTIVGRDTATGCSAAMTGSVAVGHYPLPAVHSVIGGGSYCAGGSGVNIGLDGSNVGVTYRLYDASGAVGFASGTGSIVNFGLQTAIGRYTVIATTTSTTCTSNMDSFATVSINPVVMPAVTIATGSGSGNVCASSIITFTATPTNGGATPSYAWMVNGLGSGAGSTYSYTPSDGDVVSVLLTSSNACAMPDTVSNSIVLSVLPNETPSVIIAATPGNVVCHGTSVDFTAMPTNGGSAPSYTWKKNGAAVTGASSSVYTYIPANGDVVSCLLTSSYQCRLANTVLSNGVTMEVDTPITPVVTISANPGLYIAKGETETFTATVSNAVVSPAYQWYVNNHFVPGATFATYADNDFVDLQVVTCIVTSGGGCGGSTGTSNALTIHVSDVAVQQVTVAGSNIQLIPNPNKGAFTIKGSLGFAGNDEVTVEITNMLGQVVYSNKIMANGGVINEKVQMASSQANGMYLLSLRSAGGSKVLHLVIEQ